MYEMIKLKYNYKDLEPYYSSDMFNYHYNTLYKGYTNNLNKLMSDFNDNRIKMILLIYKNYQNHYLLMQMLIYYIVYFLRI